MLNQTKPTAMCRMTINKCGKEELLRALDEATSVAIMDRDPFKVLSAIRHRLETFEVLDPEEVINRVDEYSATDVDELVSYVCRSGPPTDERGETNANGSIGVFGFLLLMFVGWKSWARYKAQNADAAAAYVLRWVVGFGIFAGSVVLIVLSIIALVKWSDRRDKKVAAKRRARIGR